MVPIPFRMRWLRAAVIVMAAVASACASSNGAVPRPFPVPGERAASRPAPLPERPPAVGVLDGYALVGTALSLRGAPYRNGGSDPNGFDCSGFTQYVFAQFGVALPREVREQYHEGKSIEPADLAPGDLVF